MINRLRAAFLPKIDPDIRRYRARTAPAESKILHILLVAWLLVSIAFSRLIRTKINLSLAPDLIVLGVLIIVAGLSYWFVKRGDIVVAGNLMASTLIALTGIAIFLSPESLYLLSAGFPLAIMAVGAIVGGTSVYPFAVIAFVVLTLGWLNAHSVLAGQGGSFDSRSGTVFLTTQAIT